MSSSEPGDANDQGDARERGNPSEQRTPSRRPERADPALIELVPMTAEHLIAYAAERTSEAGTGEFQWFGHYDSKGLQKRFVENGCIGPDGGMLSICLAGQRVGTVEWFASAWGPRATSNCWSIAIGVEAGHRGRGIGSRAQELLVRYLFDHTRAERIQAWTDVRNVVEQRALLRAGFTEEGTLRNAQWRGGAWHDQKLFSRLRGD